MASLLKGNASELNSSLRRHIRLEAARRCAAEGDVLNWGKMLMPDKFKLPFCEELHGYLVQTRKEHFTSTEAPRGHSKTTIGCMLIPLYQGLVEPKAFRHYLNVQSNEEKALAVNRAIKAEIEQNDLIRELYGDQVGRDRWTDASFVLKNGVVFSAAGSGASIRGINYRNIRPDYILCDDLYDTDADANSPANTEKKNGWFWSTLFPAQAQDRDTAIKMQGTAVNRYDLFEKLKADTTVISKTFRAVTDWEAKTVLWKGLKTFEQFEAMRVHMGSLIFAREFQNERRDDASSIIKMSWLYPDNGAPSWEYDPSTLRFDGELQYIAGVVALDPSIGSKTTNDKSGYAVVIKAQRTDGSLPVFYIEALANAHDSFVQRIDRVKGFIADRPSGRPITKARVEAIAGFKDIALRIAASVAVPCDIVDHVTNKTTNLERHSSVFENKRVFLSQDIDPTLKAELTYQLTTNAPRHDDARDAVLLGIEDAHTPTWASWV
jgi:hypothetical protein